MKKGFKAITAFITSVITTVIFGCNSALVAFATKDQPKVTTAASGGGGAVSSITTWGENITKDIGSIAKIIMIGAILVLGIMCATAGRGWAEKLKSGAAGIIIGIILVSFGTTIVTDLMS